MPIVRAQVTIPHDNALAADAVQNTFHFNFNSDFAVPAGLDPVHNALTTLYQAFDGILSAHLASTATVKYYNLDHAIPRAPVRESTIALTLGTGQMPPEMAIGVSFQGARISGTNQARRRGRVFIGPLDGTMVGQAENPAGGAITTLDTAFTNFKNTFPIVGPPEITWVVYSRTDNAAVPVSNGWIDNAWDVQRRRGRGATSRALF